ncbi:MAG: hypothetical protein AAB922_01035, partial [Patescibacteria group bacterium]
LDLRDSHPTLRPNWNGEIGNAVPFAVWHGHVRRYPINPCISQDGIDRIVADDEILALRDRVVAGYSQVWDGNNYVAKLTDDAQEAEDSLDFLIQEMGELEENCVEVWDADDWLFSSCNIQYHWQNRSLEEAVETLQSEADSEGIQIEGDIANALCLQALRELDRNPERLTGTIMEELLRRDDIKQDDFDEWKEKFAWT